MPRAGLSTDVVVAEAARLVDAVGRDRLTLAALAKAFGVAQPSLYKHVAGLDDLHRLLTAQVVTELAGQLRRACTGRAGSQALQALAHTYRQYAHDHPGRYTYVLRAPAPDDQDALAAAEDLLSVLYGVFEGYGLSGEDALDAARFVRSALHGFVSLELAGGFELPRSVDRSYERLVTAIDRALVDW